MSDEKIIVAAKLQTISDKANAILAMFEPGGYIKASVTSEAQYLFKNLKEELKEDYKRLSRHRRKRRVHDLEAQFLYPAIEDAWANTGFSSIRWDGRPNRKWSSALYDVKSYMGY